MEVQEAARVRNVLHELVDALPDDDLLAFLSMVSDYVKRALEDAKRRDR